MTLGGGEPGLPPHDDAFWAALAARRWRRVKARADGATCAVFGTPIHREGSYYLRPAYTDGALWLSERGYEAVRGRTAAGSAPPARRYGRRPPPPSV